MTIKNMNPVTFICASAVIILSGITVDAQKTEATVLLNNKTTWSNKEMFNDVIILDKSSTVKYNLVVANTDISFLIFQVHSHIYNVTLYKNATVDGPSITGTNLGLHTSIKPKVDKFYINNPNDFALKLMVSIHGYQDKDPIPGGCNMEFPVPISPFLRATHQKATVLVDAASAQYYKDPDCLQLEKSVDIEFYMMYLPERNFDESEYFEGIRKMITLEQIRHNGYRIPKTTWELRRMLSAYPGTGTIYVAVATAVEDSDLYSVYVPNHSYACSLLDVDSCAIIVDMMTKIVCGTLLFAGILTCYLGHRFFKTEMYLFGMLSGGMITYILISTMAQLHHAALIGVSILSGLCFGAIWLLFWWFYGIPVVAVCLPALNLGFLMSSILYNILPGDVSLLHYDLNFWILFILVMLVIATVLVTLAFASNLLCCAILGAYAIIFPIDMYYGSNLKFLIINTVRRATVDQFKHAVLMLPFQSYDAAVLFLWIFLAISGFVVQSYQNWGRPPFPPPPRNSRYTSPWPTDYHSIPRRSRFNISVSGRTPMESSISSLKERHYERTPLLLS